MAMNRLVCTVLKHIFGVAHGGVVDVLLCERVYMTVLGVFEYELTVPVRHRHFFSNVANFKQIVPIEVRRAATSATAYDSTALQYCH
jgi:Component of IIS longevity pathway SMK-1